MALGRNGGGYDVVVALGAPVLAARLALHRGLPLVLADHRAVGARLAARVERSPCSTHPVVVVTVAGHPEAIAFAEVSVVPGAASCALTVDLGRDDPAEASSVVLRTSDPLGLTGRAAAEPGCRLAASAAGGAPSSLRADVTTGRRVER